MKKCCRLTRLEVLSQGAAESVTLAKRELEGKMEVQIVWIVRGQGAVILLLLAVLVKLMIGS